MDDLTDQELRRHGVHIPEGMTGEEREAEIQRQLDDLEG